MSKLKKMKMSGIRSFGCGEGDEQDIIFTCPVTLFLGQNGCGKTTIIEALKYATTGDLPSGTKNGQGFIYDPQMAKTCESRGQVKLKIQDTKGESLTITKVGLVKQQREKQTFKQMDSTISRGGETISNRCIDVHREVCTSLGVPKSILNFVIFCHQEESHWPMEEPKKLKERFDAIFDSAKYNKCIENMLKIKKQKLAKQKLLAAEVDYKKLNKTQMERKRDQLREKESRLTILSQTLEELVDGLKPMHARLDEVYILKDNIDKLAVSKRQIQDQILNNEEQQKDILNNIKELDCSDKELDEKMSSFEADLKITQNEIFELEKEKMDIKSKENKSISIMNQNEIQIGKLNLEQKENNKNIETRDRYIREIISDFDTGVDSISDTDDTIFNFRKFLKFSESEIENFEKSSDAKEKQLQDDIDDHRTKYAQLKQSVDSKNKQLIELNLENQKVTRKLNELSSCDGQLQQIETRLARTEKEINQVESQINVNELRTEIQNDKIKEKSLDDQLQKVENEVQLLQTYCTIQTELDIQNDGLMKKQNDIKKLKLKHEQNFEHIFENDVPESNLKNGLDIYLKKQTRLIQELNSNVIDKEKKLSTLKANTSVQKEKLATMRTDLNKDGELITEYFQDSSFDEVESGLNKTIEDLQNKRGICKSSIKMYATFINSFKEKKPCCPVCMRDVQEKEVVKKIIQDIEKKIQAFPEDEKEAEKKLIEAQKKYSKVCELKPTYYKVKKILNSDMSILITTLQNFEKDVAKTSDELLELKKQIQIPQKNQDLANKLMSDCTLIDQYNIDIKKIQNEIANLTLKMPSSETKRNMQEAMYEQDNLKSSLKSIRSKIEASYNKLNKNSELLQTLNERKNDLKSKELNIKKDLQGKDQLEIKQQEIKSKISLISSEISEVEQNVNPTKIKLDDALKQKVNHKLEYKNKRDKMITNINKFKKKLDEIIKLHENVNNFMKRKVNEQILSINKTIEKYKQDIVNYNDNNNKITKKIDELKDQIINRKTYYRELQDNKKLRDKKEKAKILKKELQVYEEKLGDHDLKSILRDIRKLDEKITESEQEINKGKGQITELKKSVQDSKDELSEPIYANAIVDYKNKFLEYKILGKAIEDLAIFAKAVDWAMLQYHKQQMVYINETIRELWRAIYRGNDIDYIEIKTEMGAVSTKSDKRRVYQYKLVQVKNDVELEMRGRCSAGQKVLASLIIRIALADTFSTKCGILALDEPTTNLDKENIDSLCEALCELVARKRFQSNFQLLIITHDQEFLEKLGRNILIEDYYLVYRNNQGKSRVTLKNSSF